MAGLLDKMGLVSVPHEQPKVQHAKKILIMLTGVSLDMPDHKTGYFWGELLHAYEAFTEAGFDCDIVSESGQAIVDEASVGAMASAGDKKKWEDKQFHLHRKLQAIRAGASIQDIQQYSTVYVAGGHACCADLPTAQNLQRLAREIYEQGGTVSAVCHGIALFDGLTLSDGKKLVAGKKITGFSEKAEKTMKYDGWMKQHGFKTMQQVVETNGGIWQEHPSDPMACYTLCDSRVVTGMNPASAAQVANDAMKLLPSKEMDSCDTFPDKTAMGAGPVVNDKEARQFAPTAGDGARKSV